MLCASLNKTFPSFLHGFVYFTTGSRLFVRYTYTETTNSFSKGRKKMFYLTTHSTHFIYIYMASDIWKRTTQIARGNPLPFPIKSKGSFIYIIPDRITHTTAFVTSVVGYWLEQEISQWVHHERTLLPRSYLHIAHFSKGMHAFYISFFIIIFFFSRYHFS